MGKPKGSTRAYKAAAARAGSNRYVLRLFVAGTTAGSIRAVEALRALCDEHLPGRYDLQVIDVYQQPELARDEQIIAVPTLVKELPLPLRRILGDLSDKQRVLVGLDLQSKRDDEEKRPRKKPKAH